MVAIKKSSSAVQPDPGSIHVNRPLTNVSIAWDPALEGYVADKVFPTVPVQYSTDVYYEFDRSYFLRNEVGQRAPGTESKGAGYEVTTTPYLTKRYSLHTDVTDEARANSDSGIGDDIAATNLITQQLWLNREITWANIALTTGVWGTDVTGVSGSPSGAQVKQWNDSASTPITDIATYSTAMQSTTGRRGTTLVMGRQVWDALKNHPTILDLIKYGASPGSPAMVTKQAVAALFEVGQILVMEGIVNTAKEGATPVYNWIGGKKALLVNTPAAPALRTPSAGYTFSWSGLIGGNGSGQRIKKFRMEELSADRVEGDMAYDQHIVAPALGVYFGSLVA